MFENYNGVITKLLFFIITYLSVLFTVITGTVSFLGGIVLGFSVASIAYLLHWLHYKKRKAQNRDITTELSSTRKTTVEVQAKRLPVYDEIESIQTPNAIDMQQNSAYAFSRK